MGQEIIVPTINIGDSGLSDYLIWKHLCISKVLFTITGTDGNVTGTIAEAAAYGEPAGLLLDTGDADPGADDNITAIKSLINPVLPIVEIRMKLGIPDISVLKDFQCLYEIKEGSLKTVFGIKYEPNAMKIYYWQDGAWTEIVGEATQTVVDGIWTMILMRVNQSTGKYLNTNILGKEVDLTGIAGEITVPSTTKGSKLTLVGTTVGAAKAQAYVSDIYVMEATK